MSARRGSSLVEVGLAVAILTVLILGVGTALVQARKVAATGGHRLVMEVRARRYLDELSTTSYPALLAQRARPEVPLGEPGDDPAYSALVRSARAGITIEEVADGLIEARVRLEWDEVATGRTSAIEVARLFTRPTLSLEARGARLGGGAAL